MEVTVNINNVPIKHLRDVISEIKQICNDEHYTPVFKEITVVIE